MGCPIMACAGKLTGDPTYFDRAFRHLQFMQKLCLRPDGLYRHSPLNGSGLGKGQCLPCPGSRMGAAEYAREPSGLCGDGSRFQSAHQRTRKVPGSRRDVARNYRPTWLLPRILRHRHDCSGYAPLEYPLTAGSTTAPTKLECKPRVEKHSSSRIGSSRRRTGGRMRIDRKTEIRGRLPEPRRLPRQGCAGEAEWHCS